MTVINKTNKNYKRSQRGRSMVEMLGVLAIVGVLSVGGVYGYGVAMKKHKANELLHQASMLATTVSAQIDSLGGDLPETITDFGSTNYGKFSTSVTQTEDKKKFVLTIENVDSSVCDQLKKGGMVQGVECNPEAKTAKITYYKNLATNPAEGEKSPTGGETLSRDLGVCENGNVYLSYMEDPCATESPKDMECTKNSDCKSDEYCKLTGMNDEDNFVAVITGATCESLDSGTKITYVRDSISKTLLVGPKQSYWAAENWCKAHHMSLAYRTTFGCTEENNCHNGGCSGYCSDDVFPDMKNAGLNSVYWTSGTDSAFFGLAFDLSESDPYYDGFYLENDFHALCE